MHSQRDPLLAILRDASNGADPDLKLAQHESRETGRVRRDLECSVGRVLNISAGGLLVEGPEVPDGPLAITFSGEHGRLAVPARVVWSKSKGHRNYLIGFEFAEKQQNLLSRLAALESESKLERPL